MLLYYLKLISGFDTSSHNQGCVSFFNIPQDHSLKCLQLLQIFFVGRDYDPMDLPGLVWRLNLRWLVLQRSLGRGKEKSCFSTLHDHHTALALFFI